MVNLTKYPLEDWFETSLAQEWDWQLWTVNLNKAPSFTFPSWVTTYIVVDPGKTTMQIAEIDSINVWNKTVNVSNITLEKGAWINSTATNHTVNAKVIISDNYQFWKDILTAINSKTDRSTWLWEVYADETARNTAIPAPSNWMQVYVTSLWQFTDYVGWAWTPRASWVNPNASETVAGKVEIATQAEFDAWTATWWTWALLSVTPDLIQKQINTATEKTTPVNADLIGIADSADSGIIKKTTITEFKAAANLQATETTSWFVERATDAEVLAKTDTTRYITPAWLTERVKDTIWTITTWIAFWTNHEALTSWIVSWYVFKSDSTCRAQCYVWNTSPAGTLVMISWSASQEHYAPFSFPVWKWKYWRVDAINSPSATALTFTPNS